MWEEEGEVETANRNHSKEKQKNEEKQGNRGQAEAEMRSGAPGCVCRRHPRQWYNAGAVLQTRYFNTLVTPELLTANQNDPLEMVLPRQELGRSTQLLAWFEKGSDWPHFPDENQREKASSGVGKGEQLSSLTFKKLSILRESRCSQPLACSLGLDF